jgi:hypothetical protein
VCADALVITGLGCPSCGTGITGAFATCSYCALADEDHEALRAFLVSRGNMRELAAHLGVSYPTARQRYADLLERLGLAAPPGPGPERAQVLADLAAGAISVDEAEAALRR